MQAFEDLKRAHAAVLDGMQQVVFEQGSIDKILTQLSCSKIDCVPIKMPPLTLKLDAVSSAVACCPQLVKVDKVVTCIRQLLSEWVQQTTRVHRDICASVSGIGKSCALQYWAILTHLASCNHAKLSHLNQTAAYQQRALGTKIDKRSRGYRAFRARIAPMLTARMRDMNSIVEAVMETFNKMDGLEALEAELQRFEDLTAATTPGTPFVGSLLIQSNAWMSTLQGMLLDLTHAECDSDEKRLRHQAGNGDELIDDCPDFSKRMAEKRNVAETKLLDAEAALDHLRVTGAKIANKLSVLQQTRTTGLEMSIRIQDSIDAVNKQNQLVKNAIAMRVIHNKRLAAKMSTLQAGIDALVSWNNRLPEWNQIVQEEIQLVDEWSILTSDQIQEFQLAWEKCMGEMWCESKTCFSTLTSSTNVLFAAAEARISTRATSLKVDEAKLTHRITALVQMLNILNKQISPQLPDQALRITSFCSAVNQCLDSLKAQTAAHLKAGIQQGAFLHVEYLRALVIKMSKDKTIGDFLTARNSCLAAKDAAAQRLCDLLK